MKQAVITEIDSVYNKAKYTSDGVPGEVTLPEQVEGTELAPYALGDIIFIDEETNTITGRLTKEQIANAMASYDNAKTAAPTVGSGSGNGSIPVKHERVARF